jgi:hypothetical protein
MDGVIEPLSTSTQATQVSQGYARQPNDSQAPAALNMGSLAIQTTFDVEDVLSKATIAEKVALLSGIDFWHTAPIHRLGVPSIRVSDGPNGVRGTKFFNGVPAACLPCGKSF